MTSSVSTVAFPRLITEAGDESFGLSGRIVTVGSAPECHITLRGVGRRPAHFLFADGGYRLQALDPGVRIERNGEAVKTLTPLAHGDSIRIGERSFRYLEHEAGGDAAGPVTQPPHTPIEELIAAVASLLKNRNQDSHLSLVTGVSRLLRCDAARLVVEDHDTAERRTIARYPQSAGLDRFSSRAIDWAKTERQTVLVHDTEWRDGDQSMASLERNLVTSVLCVPLRDASSDSMLGYLYLDRLQGSSPFSEEQRRFCDTVAPLFVELLLNARERTRQRETILRLQQQASGESGGMIYQSSIMNELIEQARKIAATESPVLVLGDTGSGKELMARFLHDHSRRAGQPFRAINCGAIPENLIESELFGHEKGAFTGASRTRPGLFESAAGGSVFLDEIGELPLQLQVKLLRVLQEAEVSRVGGAETMKVDVRIIAATNRNLEEEVAAGRFRQDLYFRLHVLAVELPPLHARGQDVIMLAEYFIGKYCEQFGIARKSLGTPARTALLGYSWPGNVRELENVIQKAVLLSPKQRLDQSDIIFSESRLFAKTGASSGATTLKAARAEAERSIIARTLEKTGGNITLSAKILEIDRKWLMRKMEELGISAEAYRA